MCLLNFLKQKAKKKAAPEKEKGTGMKAGLILGGEGKGHRWIPMPPETEIPDEEYHEEYQLPALARGDFSMTEELLRRQQEEELKKKYGLSLPKEGSFV